MVRATFTTDFHSSLAYFSAQINICKGIRFDSKIVIVPIEMLHLQ